MSLPHGAVGWSAVCDCGTSWSYSLICDPLQILWSSTPFHSFLKVVYLICEILMINVVPVLNMLVVYILKDFGNAPFYIHCLFQMADLRMFPLSC